MESYMWVGHSSKSYNLDELYVYCNSKKADVTKVVYETSLN
jgi:hypothetical protein